MRLYLGMVVERGFSVIFSTRRIYGFIIILNWGVLILRIPNHVLIVVRQ